MKKKAKQSSIEMKIHCLYDKLVDEKTLKPHPLNPNRHSSNQIKTIAKILQYQGWRYPIKVSKRSGYVTSGHGRHQAAIFNKWKKIPVNFQAYESDEMEYADLVSDNSVTGGSELDLSMINNDIVKFGPELNLEFLALPDFKLDMSEHELPEKEKCPTCGKAL